ncbi:MAG: hypothetical protein GTO13_03760 [Proteobacteria bacterium]|nr:hypothetical protein [Pseudomonadota bacterium]
MKLKIGLISGAILGITLFHYFLGVNPLNHQLYGKLYYAPVVLAALWFGVRGGLSGSVIINLVLALHFSVDWGDSVGGLWGILFELPTLSLVGGVTGYLVDRERKIRWEFKEVSFLVSLGKTYAFPAHEMKNIAISIHGFAKLINRRTDVSDDVNRFLGIIEKESKRMDGLTRDVLSFSQNPILRKERRQMDDFLKDIILISQETAQQKGVKFCGEIREGLPPILLDSNRMREALLNMTQNAVQATPPGGAVILRAFRNNGIVKIEVSDTGKGITPGNLDKIFLPFFTTKREGTGIGLAISKKIVEAHGATIEVESREERGARFTINLPIDQVPSYSTSTGKGEMR